MFFCYRLDLLSQPPPSSEMFLFGESANSSIHNCCSAVSITFRGDKLLYFVFRLPAHLPSSFHLPKGHSCQAKISFGLRLQVRLLSSLARLPKELRVDRAFLVNSPLDLSMQPLLQNSVNLHKEFSLFDAINRPESIRRGSGEGKHMPPCTNDVNGLVACDLALNKTGFVPGESILVTATITYKSSSPLTAAQLSLIQRVSLYDRAAGNHVECVRLFASVLSSSSSSSRSKPKSWKRSNNTSMDNLGVVLSHYTEIIHVPPLPPSYSRDPSNNWLIAIDYSVFLRLRLLWSHKDIREFQMSIPITIGTNPTLDTSFDGSQISSCLAWFDYSSGFIFEQVSEEDALYACPVYRYYQPIVQSKGLPPVPANTSRQLSSQKISAANPVSSFRANSSSPILRETLYFDDDLDDANVDGFYSGISTDTVSEHFSLASLHN